MHWCEGARELRPHTIFFGRAFRTAAFFPLGIWEGRSSHQRGRAGRPSRSAPPRLALIVAAKRCYEARAVLRTPEKMSRREKLDPTPPLRPGPTKGPSKLQDFFATLPPPSPLHWSLQSLWPPHPLPLIKSLPPLLRGLNILPIRTPTILLRPRRRGGQRFGMNRKSRISQIMDWLDAKDGKPGCSTCARVLSQGPGAPGQDGRLTRECTCYTIFAHGATWVEQRNSWRTRAVVLNLFWPATPK